MSNVEQLQKLANDELGERLELTVLHIDGSLTQVSGESPAMHSSVDLRTDYLDLDGGLSSNGKPPLFERWVEMTVTFRLDKVDVYRGKQSQMNKIKAQNWWKPWYYRWRNGDNPVLWAIRETLLKMEYLGLVRLKIGQFFTFKDLIK